MAPDRDADAESELPPLGKYKWLVLFAYRSGILAVVAVFLIYFLKVNVEATQNEILALLKEHHLNSQYIVKSNADINAQLDRVYTVLVMGCVNGADNDLERQRCFGKQLTP